MATKITALVCVKNEDQFVRGCLERILPYVDSIVFVDNGSTDNTRKEAESLQDPKIRIFDYPETDNMGELRQFSLDQATGDWVWQVDCDEFYEKDACEVIVAAVNNPGDAISFRVGYHQMSFRKNFEQADFEHYPDRIYRRDVVDRYDGLLPNDMTKVKREFCTYRPFLEYDNAADKSFENPVQPILPVKYYHLARTRGYSFELSKWIRYNCITNKGNTYEQNESLARQNQWVRGVYPLQPLDVSFVIPPIKDPKVSVVITHYRYLKYIEETVESVLAQTVKPYEIIIVDDHSEDGSFEFLDRYCKEKGIIFIPHLYNQGVAMARNAGMMYSTGDYIVNLDADDLLEPTFIEKVLEKARESQSEIVYTDFIIFGDGNAHVSYPDFTYEQLKQYQCLPSCCALIDRHIFEVSGGYDPGAHYEDWDFWLKICKDYKVGQVREPLFRYRRHFGSRVDLNDLKKEEETKKIQEKYATYSVCS